jgi:hypothetical protein
MQVQFVCPQCSRAVRADAEKCDGCKARFTVAGGWRPVEGVPKGPSRSLSSRAQSAMLVLVFFIVPWPVVVWGPVIFVMATGWDFAGTLFWILYVAVAATFAFIAYRAE